MPIKGLTAATRFALQYNACF